MALKKNFPEISFNMDIYIVSIKRCTHFSTSKKTHPSQTTECLYQIVFLFSDKKVTSQLLNNLKTVGKSSSF